MSSVVNWTLVDPTGGPASGAVVQVVCINPADGAPGRVYHSDGRAIDGMRQATSDGGGLVSMNLFSQSGGSPDLTNPALSYYRVQEVGTITTTPYFIQVPQGGGPYNVSAILYNPPVVVGSSVHGAANHTGDIIPDGTDQTLGAGSANISQRTAASVAVPAAGSNTLFVDSADAHTKLKTPAGTLVDLHAGGGGGSVATDTIWDAKGDLAAGTGADTAAKVTVGADDTILMADSAQATGLKWVASATPSTQAFGDAAAAGTADTFTRGDHKHAMMADPTGGQLILAGAVTTDTTTGAITDLAITNTVYRWSGISAATIHGITGVAEGRVIIIENTSTTQTLTLAHQSATEGTATRRIICPDAGDSPLGPLSAVVLEYDNTTGRWRVLQENTYATAAAAIGTASAGTAGQVPPRGDHVHPTGAGTPSTQAFGDAAATGTGPAASMTDHKHAMPNSTAGPDADITIDAAGAAGTAATAARSAHGHKLATSATAAVAVGTAAAGTSGHAPSRDDHVHPTGAGTPTDTTPAAVSATGAGPAASMTNHAHRSPGQVARIVADAAIANTETVVTSFTAPANWFAVGMTFRIHGSGVLTSGATGGTGIFRIRIGTTTLTGNIVTSTSPVNANSQTAQGWSFDAWFTIRTITASGTAMGHSRQFGRVADGANSYESVETATVVVDSTVQNLVELTYISGNAGTTTTFKVANIVMEGMS